MNDPLEIIKYYHDRTKHRPHRFAPSLGYLDWANEPKPFRKYLGAPVMRLPIVTELDSPSFHTLLYHPENVPCQTIQIETVSKFLLFSLGISAWKEYRGERWAVRCNPSSGNLHPTEAYLICPPKVLDADDAVLYHYDPEIHALERRAVLRGEEWSRRVKVLPRDTTYFIVALTSLIWREAWKYGERAFRYCLLDLGHALSCLFLSAQALGWTVQKIDCLRLHEILSLLGLDRKEDFETVEPEFPQILLTVSPSDARLESIQLKSLNFEEWYGKPEKISKQSFEWEAIKKLTDALLVQSKEKLRENAHIDTGKASLVLPTCNARHSYQALPCYALFRKRRSAHAYDRSAKMDKEMFHGLWNDIMYVTKRYLRQILPNSPMLSYVIFASAIEGLKPGVYCIPKDKIHMHEIQRVLFPNCALHEGLFDGVNLYSCMLGNPRRMAEYLSCGQEICRDGVMVTAMVSWLDREIESLGPYAYLDIHWEAGFVGQLLYLEAELADLRGTGIGCFFDEEIYSLFGDSSISRNHSILPIYFFTIGRAIPDPRIITLPPY